MVTRVVNKREEGFTIIEVLIVLAIAGLIILIVFLAVPALQRNSRNTQRSNDIAKIGAAIDECMTSNKNDGNYCVYNANFMDYIDMSKNLQLTKVDGAGGLPYTGTPELDTISGNIGVRCNANGTDFEASSRPRSVAILWLVETGSSTAQRCKDIN